MAVPAHRRTVAAAVDAGAQPFAHFDGAALSRDQGLRGLVVSALCAIVVLACGAPDPDPGVDGGPVLDAGRMDAGADAGASATDADGDGVPVERDCDDHNASIGATYVQACDYACPAGGRQTCTDAVWSDCGPHPDCECGAEGEMRVVACERCGMQSQRCTGGLWAEASACLDAGECEGGALEEREYRCTQQQRLCRADCTWGDWNIVSGTEGECDPGTRECLFVGMYRICSDGCTWQYVSREECMSM